MMQESRIIYVKKKINSSPFYELNKLYMAEAGRKIGSSTGAVNKMIANGDELKSIMPTILGLSPTSSTWETSVTNYFRSISVEVYEGGLKLETGWKYDINDPLKKENIAKLRTDSVKLESDVELRDYVSTKRTIEEEKYKYATPINPSEYILWRYCLVYRDVSNSIEDMNKSSHIRFYLYNESEIEKVKKDKFKTAKLAMEKYLEATKNKETISNTLALIGISDSKLDDIDKMMKLQKFSEESPDEFLRIVSDKNLILKAKIERFINVGILKRLSGTNVVVDATNPEIILGNSTDEVVSFFNNDANKIVIGEYEAKYKGLK